MGTQEQKVIVVPDFINSLGLDDENKDILLLCFKHIIDETADMVSRSLISSFMAEDPDSSEFNATYNKDIQPLTQKYGDLMYRALYKSVYREDEKSNER